MTDDREEKQQTSWLPEETLILASTSLIRRTLLESALIPVNVIKADIDERKLESENADLRPYQIAKLLAEAKASSVSKKNKSRFVVGADQILEFEGRILHKPTSVGDAIRHLSLLSGRTHLLHSAVAVAQHGRVLESFHDSARMTVRDLSEKDISVYIELALNQNILTSVGAYQIEGLGIHLFSQIDGDHSTILGLPLIPLICAFRKMNLLRF